MCDVRRCHVTTEQGCQPWGFSDVSARARCTACASLSHDCMVPGWKGVVPCCRCNLFRSERIKRQLIEEEELQTALPAQRFPLVANGGATFLDQQESRQPSRPRTPSLRRMTFWQTQSWSRLIWQQSRQSAQSHLPLAAARRFSCDRADPRGTSLSTHSSMPDHDAGRVSRGLPRSALSSPRTSAGSKQSPARSMRSLALPACVFVA